MEVADITRVAVEMAVAVAEVTGGVVAASVDVAVNGSGVADTLVVGVSEGLTGRGVLVAFTTGGRVEVSVGVSVGKY